MADNISGKLIAKLPAATAAEDTDIMILENTTKTQKITWGTILNLIKTKLGIGTAANLKTTSKEIVGAVNELKSNMAKITNRTDQIGFFNCYKNNGAHFGISYKVQSDVSYPIIYIDGSPMSLFRFVGCKNSGHSAELLGAWLDISSTPWKLEAKIYVDGNLYTETITFDS